MPDDNHEAEKKLKKLGDRIREGFARENPIPQRSVETTRAAIRDEWERSRASKSRGPADSGPAKDRNREPEGPEPN